MNDRIQELAEQAGFDSVSMARFGIEQDLEKLAELIVRECVQVIEYNFDLCGDELYIAEKLKTHFGVEK